MPKNDRLENVRTASCTEHTRVCNCSAACYTGQTSSPVHPSRKEVRIRAAEKSTALALTFWDSNWTKPKPVKNRTLVLCTRFQRIIWRAHVGVPGRSLISVMRP